MAFSGGTYDEEIGATDYVAAQRSGDISDPRAIASYLKSGFIPELSPDMISTILEGLVLSPRASGPHERRVPLQHEPFCQRHREGHGHAGGRADRRQKQERHAQP